ncbi:MAG: hypothetical protein IPP81_14645 [Chitinophagaceae bacterium]|nr:hypothetical protein [Chitinophagaceae bacterium]
MMLTKKCDKDYWINKFEENRRLRLVLYVAGTILTILVLGKAAKLLGESISNFKNLHNAIQQ